MTKQLYIAKSGARAAPTLPIDAVTRTFGDYGQRGSGKTNTAVVMVEEMVRKGAHVVVIDPKGDWWGITRAGEKPGLPGIILGGDYADVPLEEAAGALVAELVVARHWPVVVADVSGLRKGARRRFLADFLEELYDHNRAPLHVVFEEAHQLLPQVRRADSDPVLGRVIGAAEDIVTLGRKRGLGVTLVSQRFATVNATVREQVETLLLHRLPGPLDRKAAKAWIETNGDAELTGKILNELASFPLGTAQLYSPGWLGKLERIRIRTRRTFDSSATPEVGEAAIEPTERAPVDLDALRERMAETVERQKANDPKELKRRIVELEKQVAERPAAEPEIVEKTVPDPEAVGDLKLAITELDSAIVDGDDVARDAKDAAEKISARMDDARKMSSLLVETVDQLEGRTEPSVKPARPISGSPAPASRRTGGSVRPSENGDVQLSKAERSVLSVLIQFPHGKPKKQLGLLSGYAHGGGSFNNALGKLRSLELISSAGSDPITATERGLTAIAVEPLPQGRGLLDYWMQKISKAERYLLQALYDAYPDSLTKEQLGEATGYAAGGGSFNNALGALRTKELAVGYGDIRASEALFE